MDDIKTPSPIDFVGIVDNDIQLFIKREDLIHQEFGGNKWRKLKFNIEKFRNEDNDVIITFGGAFSNHIAATASICKYYNIPCVGIIRGTYIDDKNPTLSKATNYGMKIHHIPKLEYKLKSKSPIVQKIIAQYSKPYLIPEGGSNVIAKLGLKEMVEEISEQNTFDHIFIAAGTGMTAAGIIDAISSSTKIWVVNVLKNPELNNIIQSNLSSSNCNWEVIHEYHFGGYAKVTTELQNFANQFFVEHNVILDPIYNAKMMYAVNDLIEKQKFSATEKVLCIHTGGLQGIEGYEYVSGQKWVKESALRLHNS